MALVDMVDSNQSPETTGQPIPSVFKTARVIAGYIAGNDWLTYPIYCRLRPDLVAVGRVLSITLSAYARARCLDVEDGGARNEQAAHWLRQYADHSHGKPILYTFASNSWALINTVAADGISRDSYYLWSADPSPGKHVCGDGRCRWPKADMTQFGQYATFDISSCQDYVFNLAPPPLPRGIKPMAIAAHVNQNGHDEVFVEAQPAGPGACGEVFNIWKDATGVWNSQTGKPHVWASMGTPGTNATAP